MPAGLRQSVERAHAHLRDDRGSSGSFLRRQKRGLVLAATERDDSAARAELTEAFLPLIATVARLYRNIGPVNRLELMQEGVAGMLKALDRYDASRGTPFWAYASWWVRQAMQQLVSEVTRPVVLSDRAFRQLAKVNDARRRHLQAHSHEPSTAELAGETGFTPDADRGPGRSGQDASCPRAAARRRR